MIYIGGSRANSYLKVAFFEDVEKSEYRGIVDALQEQMKRNMETNDDEGDNTKLPGTRKSVLKLLKMESAAE